MSKKSSYYLEGNTLEYLKQILANQNGSFEEQILKSYSILIPLIYLIGDKYGVLFERRAAKIK